MEIEHAQSETRNHGEPGDRTDRVGGKEMRTKKLVPTNATPMKTTTTKNPND
jgi:hypothetical protein